MKEKILKNGRLALIIIFILELALTFFITPNRYDDKWFIEQITNEINPETGEVIEHTISDFVVGRYNTWSSRVLIEFVLCLVLKTSKYLWVLIECLMVVLACYSISKLFVKDDEKQKNYMIIAMVLVYPMSIMHQTGWASTSINYMWPLATGLFALIPIKKIFSQEKIRWFEYPLYTLALIFAANHEQACSLLVGFYLIYTIIYIINNKKVSPYLIIQSIVAIASMIFILTCPGNSVRQLEEAYRYLDYRMLSFLDKFILGFTATFGRIIYSQNVVYIMFTLLIAAYVCLNSKEKLYKAVALIPIITVLVLGPCLGFFSGMFSNLTDIRNTLVEETMILNVGNCDNMYSVFITAISFINFIAIGMSLLVIFDKLKDNSALLIYLAGLASRIIIAFSPTVFVSKTRTNIFFDFAMIIISFLIWDKMSKEEKNKNVVHLLTDLIIIAAVIQYFNTFAYVYIDKPLF